MKADFDLSDVTWFLGLTDDAGIDVWLDGGWGVDALLGEQTRPHQDLDIALQTADGAALKPALEAQGFIE